MIILITVANPSPIELKGKLTITPVGQITEFPIDPNLILEKEAILYLYDSQNNRNFCLEFMDYNNCKIFLCLLTDQLKRKVNNEWLVDPNGKVFLTEVSCNKYYIFITGTYNHFKKENIMSKVVEEYNVSNDFNYEVMFEIPEKHDVNNRILKICERHEREGF